MKIYRPRKDGTDSTRFWVSAKAFDKLWFQIGNMMEHCICGEKCTILNCGFYESKRDTVSVFWENTKRNQEISEITLRGFTILENIKRQVSKTDFEDTDDRELL